LCTFLPEPASAQITLEIRAFAMMMTGRVDGQGNNEVLLARVNSLREEPGELYLYTKSDGMIRAVVGANAR
jgi:hypothetical protein